MRANPYVITFHDEADGGPSHLLYLLREYTVCFMRDGIPIVEGMIAETDDHEGTVTVHEYNPTSGLHDGPKHTLNIYKDFDEVMFL